MSLQITLPNKSSEFPNKWIAANLSLCVFRAFPDCAAATSLVTHSVSNLDVGSEERNQVWSTFVIIQITTSLRQRLCDLLFNKNWWCEPHWGRRWDFAVKGKAKKNNNLVVALCTKRQKTSAANEECFSSNDDRLERSYGGKSGASFTTQTLMRFNVTIRKLKWVFMELLQ